MESLNVCFFIKKEKNEKVSKSEVLSKLCNYRRKMSLIYLIYQRQMWMRRSPTYFDSFRWHVLRHHIINRKTVFVGRKQRLFNCFDWLTFLMKLYIHVLTKIWSFLINQSTHFLLANIKKQSWSARRNKVYRVP